MFRFAQFATGRIRRGGHDSVSYDMLSARHYQRTSKSISCETWGAMVSFLMPARTTETARVPEDISGRLRRVPVGSVTWRHTFRALRHRNYRLFFWGQLVSLIGTWMQQTAMSWFVYQ